MFFYELLNLTLKFEQIRFNNILYIEYYQQYEYNSTCIVCTLIKASKAVYKTTLQTF